jgi:hypothetical protein
MTNYVVIKDEESFEVVRHGCGMFRLGSNWVVLCTHDDFVPPHDEFVPNGGYVFFFIPLFVIVKVE